MIAGFVAGRDQAPSYYMKVKFVSDRTGGPPTEGGDGSLIEMKTLPQTGDRIVLVDNTTYEVISVTHTPSEQKFAAVATIRPFR